MTFIPKPPPIDVVTFTAQCPRCPELVEWKHSRHEEWAVPILYEFRHRC